MLELWRGVRVRGSPGHAAGRIILTPFIRRRKCEHYNSTASLQGSVMLPKWHSRATKSSQSGKSDIKEFREGLPVRYNVMIGIGESSRLRLREH